MAGRRKKPPVESPPPPPLPDPEHVWKNRIVGSGEIDPHELHAHPLNPRRHPKQQLDVLSSILGQVGWIQDIIVNKTTGYMLDGHARVEQALAEGQTRVPVKYVELSAEEELVALATFDPLGALAEVDQDAMNKLIAAAQDTRPTSHVVVEFLASLHKPAPRPTAVDPSQLASQFLIVIPCENAADQQAILKRLSDAGHTCRPVEMEHWKTETSA